MTHTKLRYYQRLLLIVVTAGIAFGCQKTGTVPSVDRPCSLTIVDAIPNNLAVLPVLNTTGPLYSFINGSFVFYGSFVEFSPPGGEDTVYVVQYDDTLDINPKTGQFMFYDVLPLKSGRIYSLFLTGADTSAPDHMFTTDSLPSYAQTDSVVGIRFVNLSTGSNPISINLEGSQNGSEVTSLPYKGITSFKPYANNSTTQDYVFVIRDAATGDSLTAYDFVQNNSSNNGYGLIDPNNGNLLTFKNVTIALIGQPGVNAPVPQSAILIDDY